MNTPPSPEEITATRQVFYARTNAYTPENMRTALAKTLLPVLQTYGGAKGKSVMIKPNLLEWKGEKIPVCVDPVMLTELCRMLLAEGAAKVAIIENPAVRTVPVILECMGIASTLTGMGVEIKTCADYQFVDMPSNALFQRMEVAQEYRNFDLIIDFAKAKTHGMMTLTLAVKNLFGLIRGSERLGWHLAVGKDYSRFCDMLLDIYLLVKPHISLLDAVVAMEGNGPGSGDPVELGFIACSGNALTLDASVCGKMGVPDLLLLDRAEKRGLDTGFADCGDVPAPRSIRLPDPPQMQLEWGVYFPPKLRNFLRKNLIAKPVVDAKRCIGCGMCAKMCPPRSLQLVNGKPVFKLSNCIRCFCCQEHCPCGAITSKKTMLMRYADQLEKIIRRMSKLFKRKKRKKS